MRIRSGFSPLRPAFLASNARTHSPAAQAISISSPVRVGSWRASNCRGTVPSARCWRPPLGCPYRERRRLPRRRWRPRAGQPRCPNREQREDTHRPSTGSAITSRRVRLLGSPDIPGGALVTSDRVHRANRRDSHCSDLPRGHRALAKGPSRDDPRLATAAKVPAIPWQDLIG